MKYIEKFIVPIVLVVCSATIGWLASASNSSATFDRFKMVGRDEVKYGYDVDIVADIETGCLYGQIGGTYHAQMFVLAGQPKCGTGGK